MSVTEAAKTIWDRLFAWVLFLGLTMNVLALCMQFLLTGEAEPGTSFLVVFLVGYTWWTLATTDFQPAGAGK